jgi:hypothetical protein
VLRDNASFDLAGIAQVGCHDLHTEQGCCRLNCAQLTGRARRAGLLKYNYFGDAGRNLFEKLQPFPADAEID